MDVLDRENRATKGRSLESVLAEGFEFKLGEYINKGFRLFGEEAGMYIAFLLVMFAVSFVLALIPILGLVANLLVGAPLMAGWFHFAQRQYHGVPRSFGNFFDGFKNPFWINYVVSYFLIQVFVSIVIVAGMVLFFSAVGWDNLKVLWEAAKLNDPEEMSMAFIGGWSGSMTLAFFFIMIAAIVVYILYILTPMFIAFRGMSFWNAMEASRKVVTKAFPQFFVLFLILSALMVVGSLMCMVGLLIMMPVFYLVLFAAFEDIIGSGEVNQL